MFEMPLWGAILIGSAAVATAVAVLWKKVIKPTYRLVRKIDDMIPVLVALTVAMKDSPEAFIIMKAIVGQFRNDSGSTLRDVIDRLETNSLKNREMGHQLANTLMVIQRLADEDRRKADRLEQLVNILDARLIVGIKGVARIEEGAKVVADDLAAAHQRADAIDNANVAPGTAADAAAQSKPK